jgi:hypothetical protein
MVKLTTNEKNIFMCKKCDKDKYNVYKTSCIVLHSPIYMNLMSSIHLIYIKLLSLVDIGLHIVEKHWGFNVGKITKKSLLNNPLLSWDHILEKTLLEMK